MFKDKTILGIIPARGGSRGIPRKNLINLCGKPLISYTIEAGLKSKYIDYLMVTTDDIEIAEVSKQYGADVPFLRPKELADDKSKTVDAIVHAINTLKDMSNNFDVLVLLQPTQPLREVSDIDRAIEYFFEKEMKGLVSISPVEDHPILIRKIDEDGTLSSLLGVNSTVRRPDMPTYYRVNGCIYINKVDDITAETSFNDNPIGYLMDQEHSVDIDEMVDLIIAQYYINNM